MFIRRYHVFLKAIRERKFTQATRMRLSEFWSNYFLNITQRKHIFLSKFFKQVNQVGQVSQQRFGQTKYEVYLVSKRGRIPSFIGIEAFETHVRFECVGKRVEEDKFSNAYDIIYR